MNGVKLQRCEVLRLHLSDADSIRYTLTLLVDESIKVVDRSVAGTARSR